MNSARVLYSILNVIIILILIGISLGIFFFVMLLFGESQDFLFVDDGVLSLKTETMLYVYTILRLGIYGILIKGLWSLREGTKLFLKKDFYNNELTNALSKSGRLMVIAGVCYWCVDGINNVFFKFRFVFGLSEKTLVYLFIIAIGLFFMLISTVLKDAKAIKEENDLTI